MDSTGPLDGAFKLLAGGTGGARFERMRAGHPNIGILISPCAWRSPGKLVYAVDNDVFAHRTDPDWWQREGENNWLKMLDKLAGLGRRPLFTLLPDVVGDWRQTLARAVQYRHELVDRNLPIGIALQDGIEDWGDPIHIGVDYVFIGGTQPWKWRYAHEIVEQYHSRYRVPVHVGAVNSYDKIRYCREIGADSADGAAFQRYDHMFENAVRAMNGRPRAYAAPLHQLALEVSA